MNFNRRHFLGAVAAGSAGLMAGRAFAEPLSGDSMALLPLAMAALDRNAARIAHRDLVGLVNFSAPSRQPRFHLVDLTAGKVVSSMLVAHGSGSDPGNSGWAQRFSNRAGSNASSKGAFVTGDTYWGKHGRSRKLLGLEAENSAALERGIVIHAAGYVDQDLAIEQGRIGRSQGCFAVARGDIMPLLERLGPGRLLFAYKD